jgi:hypothetical protein
MLLIVSTSVSVGLPGNGIIKKVILSILTIHALPKDSIYIQLHTML